MSISRYTAEEIAAVRADWPQHWIVEVVTAGASCLIAIAATPENLNRPIAGLPGMTGDLLDGATIHSGESA